MCLCVPLLCVACGLLSVNVTHRLVGVEGQLQMGKLATLHIYGNVGVIHFLKKDNASFMTKWPKNSQEGQY